MDTRILAIIIILTVITAINLVFYFRSKKKVNLSYDILVNLFEKEDITNLEYIRNKIVLTFNDVSSFNVETLKSEGAKGINIVGDKVKFFIFDEASKNESVYNEISKKIGR